MLIGDLFSTHCLKAGFCPNALIMSLVPCNIISSISTCLSRRSSFNNFSSIVTFAPGTMEVLLNCHFETV